MIQFQNLCYRYPSLTNSAPAIKNVSLTIPRKKITCILGANGSGKSTLAKLACGLFLPASGEIFINGKRLTELKARQRLSTTVSLVSQNPDSQVVATTVREDVAFGPKNLGLEKKEVEKRVNWALSVLNLTAIADKEPHQLSAGQRQKVVIAGILALKPDYIFFDEATSRLDNEGKAELELIYQQLLQLNITPVILSHNTEDVWLADYLAILAGGQVLAAGGRELFKQPQLFQQALLAVPDAPLFSREELGEMADKDGFRRSSEATDLHSRKSGEIGLKNLSFSYPFQKDLAISNVSGTVKVGSCLGVIGVNGSGKTTLIQLLAGLIKPTAGELLLNGQKMVYPLAADTRRRIGVLFQEPERQLFERTVFDDVAFWPRQHGFPEEKVASLVAQALAGVGLNVNAYGWRSPFQLSGGEMRRVAIAGVLTMQPEVLLLDEPFMGLDYQGQKMLLELMQGWCQEGRTVIFCSHNLPAVAALATEVWFLDKGKIVAAGLPEEVFNDYLTGSIKKREPAFPKENLFRTAADQLVSSLLKEEQQV